MKKLSAGCLSPLILKILSFALLLLLNPHDASAGEFRVTPIRLDFDNETRTAIVNVLTEGPEKLNLQIKALEWTQDSNGKDAYADTSDIIFFPKIMTVEGGEEKSIRAGVQMPPPLREKTYRLFVEEIPQPKKKSDGVNIAIAIRFGIPVFVKPAKDEVKAEINKVELSAGVLGVLVTNTGNVHLQVTSVDLKGFDSSGREVFSQQIGGWYLLNGGQGSTPPHTSGCWRSKIDVEVVTDRLTLKARLKLAKRDAGLNPPCPL